MQIQRSDSFSLTDENCVVARVAFPDFGIIKSVRCVKSLPIGEIKSAFHAQCKFEDELYSIFIPAVDAKGILGFADGKWCDDGKLVQDYNIQQGDKLILAKRIPLPQGPGGSQPQGGATPAETKKSRRLSRRILGFFGASSDSKSSQHKASGSNSSDVADPQSSGNNEEEEFIKFANSFAQRSGRSATSDGAGGAPSITTSSTAASPALPKAVSAGPTMTRPRRMTFDAKNLCSLLSMEAEPNPAKRRHDLVLFLSDFLQARVSVDELISSGIITVDPPPPLCDSPVNIDFVRQMFDWILKNGVVEGIFRISGPSQDIDSMTSILNKGLLFDFHAELNPHLVASVLKKYIRDRPFATVPYRCYRSAILRHDSLPDKYAPFTVEECKAFIESLPDDKPQLFRLVVKNLKKLSVHKEQTKMGVSNLAIVWAPVLMRCHGDGLSLFSESDRQTDFLIRIIEIIDEIVKDEITETPVGDEKTDKRKRHKHHHHHHHKRTHSSSRSARRKSESANSSPALSPSLAPIAPEFSASQKDPKIAPLDIKSSQRTEDESDSDSDDSPLVSPQGNGAQTPKA